MPHIVQQLNSVHRLDVVRDVYTAESFKTSTRQKRGHGQRKKVRVTISLQTGKVSYEMMQTSRNLFAFLAKEIEKYRVSGKQIVSTCHENVVCPSGDISLGNFAPCTHEEADTRLLLHAADCVKQGHTVIIIRTSDTEVVELAISLSQQLGAKDLWTSFGTGTHFRYIAIHDIASKHGPDKSKALPVSHAITGCDTVSLCAGRGKLKAWEAWMAFPFMTQAFLELAACKEEISTSTLGTLEHFIALMFQRNSPYAGVNEAREKWFSKGSRSTVSIPPTSDILLQHVLLVAYQEGFV